MGLFSKDWSKELDRAERLLADDVPVAALELAERAERKADADLRTRAVGLVARARQALLASLLAKAEAAEAVGDWADAADWLTAAIEREPSAVRRAEHERRRAALERRGTGSRELLEREVDTPEATAEPVPDELDVEHSYRTLMSMMRPDMRDFYEDRPDDFRRAVVELHAGCRERALPVLEAVVAASPDDGVAHLELGHAQGEPAAARDAFDAAWRLLGPEPLDDQGSLLIPALWAECALEAGDYTAVIDRLEPLASPESGQPTVCWHRARAMMLSGQHERAVGYLERTTAAIPGDTELNQLFAEALVAVGQVERARQGLERVVAASCTTGCGSPPLHAPAIRLLADLHLRAGGDVERSRELIGLVASRQNGVLGREDLEIMARYYRATGDDDAAARADAAARELAEAATRGAD